MSKTETVVFINRYKFDCPRDTTRWTFIEPKNDMLYLAMVVERSLPFKGHILSKDFSSSKNLVIMCRD